MLPEFALFVLAFVAIGAVAGFLAGLLGIGGGLIIVPALAAWLAGHPNAMHVAVATSLASITITSVSSLLAHQRHGAIDWPRFTVLAPGLVIGAALGAAVAAALSGDLLGAVFGVFCVVAGGRMVATAAAPVGTGRPTRLEQALVAVAIGIVSAIVGIGGGTLTVPYLGARGLAIHRAVGTSAACGLPIAVAGMIAFMVLGEGAGGGEGAAPALAPSVGYVWIPAMLSIGLVAAAAAPLGARTAHRSSQRGLKRGFGLFLVALGLYFIARAAL